MTLEGHGAAHDPGRKWERVVSGQASRDPWAGFSVAGGRGDHGHHEEVERPQNVSANRRHSPRSCPVVAHKYQMPFVLGFFVGWWYLVDCHSVYGGTFGGARYQT